LPEIGTRIGKITVTGYILGVRQGVSNLLVRCDCGRPEHSVARNNFKARRSTRCDRCAKLAGHEKRYWVFSEAMPDDRHRSRLLNRLSAAISRCHVPGSRGYKYYGLRGISVWPEWREDRLAFLRFVQTLPGWDNPAFDMDRTSNDGNYEPGNIQFVSRSKNMANRRNLDVLEGKIRDLEARLRSYERGAKAPLHDPE
jgi:hypothetical protein